MTFTSLIFVETLFAPIEELRAASHHRSPSGRNCAWGIVGRAYGGCASLFGGLKQFEHVDWPSKQLSVVTTTSTTHVGGSPAVVFLSEPDYSKEERVNESQ